MSTSFQDLFKRNPKLKNLIQKIDTLQQVRQVLDATIPSDLRPGIKVGPIREGTLILIASSSLENIKIGFYLNTIHQHLAEKLSYLKLARIQIKIDPRAAGPRAQVIAHKLIFTRSAEGAFEALTETLADTPLRKKIADMLYQLKKRSS